VSDTVLGLIPARAGSKGIPGKNTRLLHGRPLLAYTADTARESGVIDRLILSTEDKEIAAVGRAEGLEVPFLRPATLASDSSPMIDVVRHALSELVATGWEPEIIVLLQPTSPLRASERVRQAVSLLRAEACDSVVTVVELPRHYSPDYVMRIERGRLEPFLATGPTVTRRQDARLAYVRDGSVYAFWRETVSKYGSIYGQDCRALVIPSAEAVTLDVPSDWIEAESEMRKRNRSS